MPRTVWANREKYYATDKIIKIKMRNTSMKISGINKIFTRRGSQATIRRICRKWKEDALRVVW